MSQSGPPYASPYAIVGQIPTVIPDVPISAIFIVMYLTSAITNITLFRRNQARGHKFLPTAMLTGFSMARVTTLVLRIAWSTRRDNVRLGLAAQIFVNAGILIVYVLNVIFAQRILRAEKPTIGWHPVIRWTFRLLYVLIGAALAMVITAIVLTAYTRDPSTQAVCRALQRAAGIYLFVFTVLPLCLLAAAHVLPDTATSEHFGQHSMKSKKIILGISSCLCMTIAGFKVGTGWMPPHLVAHPAWYQSKASFYIFTFVLEIIILLVLVPGRIDQRFHVPNGSKGPGDYTRLKLEVKVLSDSESEKDTEMANV